MLAVAGASGYVGRTLVADLDARGERVIALGRHPDTLPDGENVTRAAVDVGDTDAATEALKGVRTAYYLVHSMAGGAGFAERDRAMAESFGEAARRAGVERIVYLGGLGGGDLSEHLASRQEVGRVLGAHGVPVVELRAAVIIGAGSISFEMLRYLTERLPAMVCPRWVSTRVQPLAEADLLAYLRQAPDVAPGVYEVGGPDVLTYQDLMQLYARVRGLRRRRILRVPLLTPGLSSRWVDFVTPVDHAVSRSLVDSLRNDVVVTRPPSGFSVEPTPMAEAIRTALDVQFDGIPERLFDFDNGVEDGVFTLRTEVALSGPQVKGARLDLTNCGGSLRWYGLAWAWMLRILLGKLFGERLGLYRPDRVEVGARVDWWRVASYGDHHIVLATTQWFCGEAWLGYRISGHRLEQVGALRAKGLLGLAYWRAVYPIHLVVFRIMARGQAERALALVRAGGATPTRTA